MFSISQIRAQARQTINSTPGIFLLPIIPVAMTFIWTVFQYFRNDTLSYYDPAAPLAPLFSSFAFPLLYGLLMSFISISLAWTLLLVVRGIKKTTELKDVFAIFNSPHLGKIFVTFLLKQFYLFLWGLIFYVGLGMFIFAMVLSFFFALSAGSVDSIPDESLAVIGFLVIFGLFALIGGLVLFVPQYLAYSQVEYILFDQLEKNEYFGAKLVGHHNLTFYHDLMSSMRQHILKGDFLSFYKEKKDDLVRVDEENPPVPPKRKTRGNTRELGDFEIVGQLPKAFNHPSKGFVDALVM